MNPSFWQGKRVFITGHTGFKGGWISLWLQSMGAEVTGYALQAPTNPSLFEIAKVGAGMSSIIGDVRDADALCQALRQSKAEIVIHMAAQPLVRYSYDHPVETYSTNVMGLVNLYEAVRKVGGVRVIVNVTSDKCYENREWVWGYRENEPMGGYDPYSNSKGCAELVTSAYRSSYFNPQNFSDHGIALASVRAGNVIGGGDWALDRLVPDIVRALKRSQPVLIRSPHAIRPWQHVLEPLSGYLLLAEKLYTEGPVYAEGWNFGPADTDARPVSWIVQQMCAVWGGGASWLLDDRPAPHEAYYLKLDCSKAKARLGWSPVWNMETAISKIVDWYKAAGREEDMHAFVMAQINDYRGCRR